MKIRKHLQRMDPKLTPDHEAFNYALMLLASVRCGTSADKCAAAAELPRAQARIVGKRLRKCGLWVGRKIHHSGWDDKKAGGIAFWLDVNVAMGMMKRVCGKDRP